MSFYMSKRQDRFYFRIRVPQDLQHHFSYPEIKRSLRTKDPSHAKSQARIWSSKAEKVFMSIRANILPSDQIQSYIHRELPSLWRRSKDPIPSPIRKQRQQQQKKSKKLQQIIEEYIQEHLALGKWTEKTRIDVESCLVIFHEIVGNKSINSLERKDMVNFLEKLTKLPANMKKKPEYKNKTILQILNMKGSEPMSTRTINKYVSRVGALMIYCVRQGYIDRNPVEGLSLARNVSAEEERSAYSIDDLTKLISTLAEVKKDAPERFWVPYIGMYSGARQNEICQLYVADVVEVDSIWCFDINGDKDKRLKNFASKRMIPIHPKLIDLGFLEYVEKLKASGAVRLWERLPAGRDGYSYLFGKWYQRHNRLFLTQDKRKCFHSLRHTLADTLKQAGVAEGVIAEILGHSNDSITTGRYGKRFRPQILLDALMKLDY